MTEVNFSAVESVSALDTDTLVEHVKTGQLARVVSLFDSGDLVMLKSGDSDSVFYAMAKELRVVQELEEGEVPIHPAALARAKDTRAAIPAVKLDPNAVRYNLNEVTADQLCRALKGLSPENAKTIITERNSQTTSKFSNWDNVKKCLDQVIDIDAIKNTNIFYIQ